MRNFLGCLFHSLAYLDDDVGSRL